MLWVDLIRKRNIAFINTFHLSISSSSVNSVECSPIYSNETSLWLNFVRFHRCCKSRSGNMQAGKPRHIASMFGLPWWNSMEKPQSLSLRVLKLSIPKECQLRNRWLPEPRGKHRKRVLPFVHHIAFLLLGFQWVINPKNNLGFVEMVGIWHVRGRSDGPAHHARVFTKHNWPTCSTNQRKYEGFMWDRWVNQTQFK